MLFFNFSCLGFNALIHQFCTVIRRIGSQPITPLILRMSRMALHPIPGDLMGFCCCQQTLPQIHIFHRVIFPAHPILFLPVVQPMFRKGLDHISRIRKDLHLAGAIEDSGGAHHWSPSH